jgi:hypothetical protein
VLRRFSILSQYLQIPIRTMIHQKNHRLRLRGIVSEIGKGSVNGRESESETGKAAMTTIERERVV